jgi:hypothetical protein
MAEQAPEFQLQPSNITVIFKDNILNIPTNNISNKVNQGYKGLTEDCQWISSVQEKKNDSEVIRNSVNFQICINS